VNAGLTLLLLLNSLIIPMFASTDLEQLLGIGEQGDKKLSDFGPQWFKDMPPLLTYQCLALAFIPPL